MKRGKALGWTIPPKGRGNLVWLETVVTRDWMGEITVGMLERFQMFCLFLVGLGYCVDLASSWAMMGTQCTARLFKTSSWESQTSMKNGVLWHCEQFSSDLSDDTWTAPNCRPQAVFEGRIRGNRSQMRAGGLFQGYIHR